MYDRFWKAALTVGGLGAVGAFVFWSLYKDWLKLSIFERMTQGQTFALMVIFLVLTFGALLFIGYLYLARPSKAAIPASDHAFKLHDAWEGVNEIDCEKLIGPDVSNAARAMTITASSWLNGLVDKKVILENHFDDFELLYLELSKCDRVVPGFERRGLKCPSFISDEMKKAYSEMLASKQGASK